MGLLSNFIKNFTGRLIYAVGQGSVTRRDIEVERQEQCAAIIDCNATHIARGKVLHVRLDGSGRIAKIERTSEYTKLFERPNPMMTRRDFMYVMAYQLQVANISVAWIKWEGNHPKEVWPICFLKAEICETVDGGFAISFTEFGGIHQTVRLEDCIVLRDKYDGVGYMGMDNGALKDALNMAANLDEGFLKATAVSNKVHGLFRQKNAMLATKSAEEAQKDFSARMSSAASGDGVIALDATEDYTPLNVNTWTATAAQMIQIYQRIYTYWRTPQEVVNNTASEQVMQNYYDSKIEPIWEGMSEAFTQALFTHNEQNYGSRMIVMGGAATGASMQTKLNIINAVKETGLLMVNEQRELLGYGPTEDGDVRLVSLNYIKSTDMSNYQVGKDEEEEQDETNEPEEGSEESEKEGDSDGTEGNGEEGQGDA